MSNKRWNRFVLGLCALGALAGVSLEAAPRLPESHFKKVMIIVFENTNYEDVLRQPFFSSLARRGALLTRYSGITHPSQPNYIAMISGSTHGVLMDVNQDVDARHIGDLLEAKGYDWKVYAEGFPGHCFLGARSGYYVRKHVPFISFKNVQEDPARCGRIVEASRLRQDVDSGRLPAFSMYIPDLLNDGHDTGVAYADRWFASAFGPLLKDPKFTADLLLVVTFDESESYLGNHVATMLIGDGIIPGSTSDASYDHYSTLRTIEDELGLGTLGQNDLNAQAFSGVWR